jgi:DNA-binding CsgD family transcriptional regulator
MMLNTKHPLLSISQQLAPLCEHLKSLGIHQFSYIKKFADGKRLNLSNCPQWIDDYYNMDLYKSSLFEGLSLEPQSKFDIWLGDYDLEIYRHGKMYYNTSHSITITEANNKFSEIFLFATTPDNPHAINALANHIDLLYHFIAYLKDQGRKLFQEAEKHRLILTDCNPLTDLQQNIQPLNDLISKFYQSTRVYKYCLELQNGQKVNITDREIDCLSHLLQNRNASQTAKLMNLSRRTVESYLDNIRLKLACDSKSELYQQIVNDKYFKVLRLNINNISSSKSS